MLKNRLNVKYKGSTDELRLTFFSFNVKISQDEGKGLRTKTVKSKSPRVHKVVPTLNRTHVINSLLHSLFVLALQLRSCLSCSKRET